VAGPKRAFASDRDLGHDLALADPVLFSALAGELDA
jgi:hypothetical protein